MSPCRLVDTATGEEGSLLLGRTDYPEGLMETKPPRNTSFQDPHRLDGLTGGTVDGAGRPSVQGSPMVQSRHDEELARRSRPLSRPGPTRMAHATPPAPAVPVPTSSPVRCHP